MLMPSRLSRRHRRVEDVHGEPAGLLVGDLRHPWSTLLRCSLSGPERSRGAVSPDRQRGPRLRVVSGRRPQGGRRGGDRPAVGHRALPAPEPHPRGAHRAHPRDAQPRRPRQRPRPARPRHRAPPSTSTSWPAPSTRTRASPTAGSWRWARCGSRRCTPPATGPSTPPSCSATRGAAIEPWALLSGDSLFVGDVARPDLAVEPREGASEIYRSLHERLMTLGDEVEVWPGHLGGSLCGSAGLDHKTSSTIGFERAHNRALEFTDQDAFVEDAVASIGSKPPERRAHRRAQPGPAAGAARQPRPR